MNRKTALALAAAICAVGTASHAGPKLSIWVAPLRHEVAVDLGEGDPSGPQEAHDCSANWNGPAAIKRLLFQMGAPVEDWPAAVPAEQCLDLHDCVERLRTKSLKGYMLGGQIMSRRHQPSTVRLWLVDVASGRAMLSAQRCFGCEEPAALARQAAALAQRAQERYAHWIPLVSLPRCSSASSAGTSPSDEPAVAKAIAQPSLPHRSILLSIYGAKVPEKDRLLVRRATQQILGLLGRLAQPFSMAIHPDAPRSSLRPAQQNQPLLDIELLYGDERSNLSEARLRLSTAQHTRQSSIHCTGAESCTPAALSRQLRLQVAALLDAMDELSGASATVMQADPGREPPALCLPVLQCAAAPASDRARNISACAGCAAEPRREAAVLLVPWCAARDAQGTVAEMIVAGVDDVLFEACFHSVHHGWSWSRR